MSWFLEFLVPDNCTVHWFYLMYLVPGVQSSWSLHMSLVQFDVSGSWSSKFLIIAQFTGSI
jgi:hypothetical protein